MSSAAVASVGRRDRQHAGHRPGAARDGHRSAADERQTDAAIPARLSRADGRSAAERHRAAVVGSRDGHQSGVQRHAGE